MDRQHLADLAETYRRMLLDDTVPFWERNGVDREAGGFFSFLDRDGSVYCTDKPVWLMGRATWLFATLYREVEPRPAWLDLAWHGHDFLVKHCFDEHGKMYFSVTRDGRPLRMRRYVFSEVFGVMAFSALARATGDERAKQRAVEAFRTYVRYTRTPGLIEPKTNASTRPMKGLSPLMCLVSIADLMRAIDDDPLYERLIDETIEEIFRDFVRPEEEMVLEVVSPDGEPVDTPEGRLLNPGHAIEAAWFIMDIARRRSDRRLIDDAARLLRWSFERGWDREYGGLLYFVDAAGKPPAAIEHDMKLWWPHCETLVGALLAWHLTGDARFEEIYNRTHEWTLAHFPDPDHGEWFGYLRRDGAVSTTLKGNTWKGAFHVPRTQLLCWKLLSEMSATSARWAPRPRRE